MMSSIVPSVIMFSLGPHGRAEANRKANLRKNYGVDPGWVDSKLVEQAGRCAICGSTEPRGRNWHVDHDHRTWDEEVLGG